MNDFSLLVKGKVKHKGFSIKTYFSIWNKLRLSVGTKWRFSSSRHFGPNKTLAFSKAASWACCIPPTLWWSSQPRDTGGQTNSCRWGKVFLDPILKKRIGNGHKTWWKKVGCLGAHSKGKFEIGLIQVLHNRWKYLILYLDLFKILKLLYITQS